MTAGDRTHQQLFDRARAGDDDAYERLFALAHERVRLYARARMGPAARRDEESLDVLQATFLEAHQAFSGLDYRGQSAFLAWLCGIAENRIRRGAERRRTAKRTPPGARVRLERVRELVEASRTGPASVVARFEERERLLAAMDELPEEERNAVLLRFFRGLPLAAVAAELGRSESTARRLVARAAVRLGALLGGAA